MNRIEYEEKAAALTQEINRIEWLEEDFLSLKRKHEERVLDLQSEFHHLSFEVEALLHHVPEGSPRKYIDLQRNGDLKWQMDHYVREHLDQLSHHATQIRHQLDDEREERIRERNRLTWE
ncbi:hypothetical protein ACVRXS_10565 [Streptococcus orisratti]|uniref:hypothetical protein n=1 Tax=Streptococcus orisratti TaxID=114652 RepID=UPI0003606BDD|nr:hypothetical protein [Streptococcus orisratti]